LWWSHRFLFSRGADLNSRDATQATALFEAAYKKRPDLVRTLLELGANPFAYDR
jgi:ankyrin repeat protein